MLIYEKETPMNCHISFLKRRTLPLFILLFICTITYSQNYFDAYQKIDFKKTEKLVDKEVDSLLKLSRGKVNYIDYTKISHAFSVRSYKRKNIPKAIKYGLLEKEAFENYKVINPSYIKILYNLGRFYYRELDYNTAIFYYKKVLLLDTTSKKAAQSFCELGRVYAKKGALFKAIDFFNKGILLLESQKEYRTLYSQYVNLVAVLSELKITRNKEVLKNLDKAKSLFNKVKLPSRYRMTLNSGYANFYSEINAFRKAKTYYFKNITLASSLNDNRVLSSTYNNLADFFLKKKSDSALFFLKKGLEIAENKITIALLHDNYSDYYISKNDLGKALKSIHKALEVNTGLGEEIESVPDILSLSNSKDKEHVLSCLKKKAEVLIKLYEQNNDIEYLNNAVKNIKAADDLVAILLESSSESKTKLMWRKEASEAYVKGAFSAQLLEDDNTVFYFMERNKALLLTESIAKNTEQSNLPKRISDMEITLKKGVLTIENSLLKEDEEIITVKLQDSLFNAKQQYQKYIDSIRPLYPKYFNNKIQVEQVSLVEIQKELDEKSAVLSFIWNQLDGETEILLGTLITNKQTISFKIGSIEDFKKNIESYKILISKTVTTKEQQKEFQKVSYSLYQQLFPTEEIRDLIKDKRLTIIPDGELQNIPFEAFITKENSQEYLIQSNDISYAYSMSFLQHNEQVKRTTENNFIGYSPITFNDTSLSTLDNSKLELEGIHEELGGEMKMNGAATKSDFLENSSKSKIIHLATHADASNNPWIDFSDDKLELHELYTYKNNADLVVLSACNTSLGEVAKGEGVLSLARGFFYSGSKSVVSSLWKVNDASTAEIMTSFYKNLEKGQTKSAALTNAKRSYINSHELSEQSPYYWSSFVLIGDANEIDLSNNNFIYYTILLLIMVISYFLFKKYKKAG